MISSQQLSQIPPDLLAQLTLRQETFWFNPALQHSAQAVDKVGLAEAVQQAAARWQRFAPLLAHCFPETQTTAGIIESPLVRATAMQAQLDQLEPLVGKLWLKLDNALPISGSIKARGGIYAVLEHAEQLALEAGLIHPEQNYRQLASPESRQFFSGYRLSVGSTGNLGLSIGIIGAALGFETSVHMSADAKAWKKQRLRDHGVKVFEYRDDYSVAVAQGRLAAEQDDHCFFIDDENSQSLFLGYAVAGLRLAQQLAAQNIIVDTENPLIVYLPCGVGGGPGGVAYGLKLVFGNHVHCFFAEPLESPCMLLGLSSGLHDQISVQDIGLSNQTAADGLAVGRASGFVGRRLQSLISGCYTLSDDNLYRHLALLVATEGIVLEPSALAGMVGPQRLYQALGEEEVMGLSRQGLARATHLVWATGGGMVPAEEQELSIARGKQLLAEA